jgi:M3 family oligoendopeptidase
MERFDYGPEQAAAFRRQIREIVTPAVEKLRERQRKRLGLDRLFFYDETLLFPEGNPSPIGTTEELVEKAQAMYREMSPETGEFFDFMVKYRLFDLKTRPGKHMGGYMASIPAYKAPFIFSNFNGTSADVDVLTHEAGHAFQGYLSMRSIPVRMIQGSTAEVSEIHSMTMEHFTYPWMESFFGDKAEDYVTGHLVGSLAVLPYMASVDEFQHRVYEKPDMDAIDRRRTWREIEKAYMPWRDYDGEPFLEEGGFWMQKQHIFLYPFYYIDYALAQMGASYLYGLSRTDPEKAWKDYLTLLKAGGTKSYFELLSLAGIPNPFEEGNVEKCVGHMIREALERYQ